MRCAQARCAPVPWASCSKASPASCFCLPGGTGSPKGACCSGPGPQSSGWIPSSPCLLGSLAPAPCRPAMGGCFRGAVRKLWGGQAIAAAGHTLPRYKMHELPLAWQTPGTGKSAVGLAHPVHKPGPRHSGQLRASPHWADEHAGTGQGSSQGHAGALAPSVSPGPPEPPLTFDATLPTRRCSGASLRGHGALRLDLNALAPRFMAICPP